MTIKLTSKVKVTLGVVVSASEVLKEEVEVTEEAAEQQKIFTICFYNDRITRDKKEN